MDSYTEAGVHRQANMYVRTSEPMEACVHACRSTHGRVNRSACVHVRVRACVRHQLWLRGLCEDLIERCRHLRKPLDTIWSTMLRMHHLVDDAVLALAGTKHILLTELPP